MLGIRIARWKNGLSLLMPALVLVALAVTVSEYLVPSVAQAAAAAEKVTIEAVDTVGDASLSRGLIESALGVAAGKTLMRDELDSHLAEAERRLTALGYYKIVDISLVRGATRGFYRIRVRLEAKSAAYVGTEVSGQQQKTAYDSNSKLQHYEVFTGTRDSGLAGARFEISAAEEFSGNISDYPPLQSHYESTQRMLFGKATGLWPDIMGSPFFAFDFLQYMDGTSESTGKSTYSALPSEQPAEPISSASHGRVNVLVDALGVGYRHELSTFSLFGIRAHSDARDHSVSVNASNKVTSDGWSTFTEWFSVFGSEFSYSDKTQLAAIEPGTTVHLFITREMGSADTGLSTSADFSVLHTWIVHDRHALTPTLISELQGNSDPSDRYYRSYDAGLTYEYVTPWDFVLGLEHAKYGIIDDGNQGPEMSTRRTTVSLRYVSNSLIVNLSFIYGTQGLVQDIDPLNTSRLSQP